MAGKAQATFIGQKPGGHAFHYPGTDQIEQMLIRIGNGFSF